MWQILLIDALISRHTAAAMDHPEGVFHLQKRTGTSQHPQQLHWFCKAFSLAFQQTLLATF